MIPYIVCGLFALVMFLLVMRGIDSPGGALEWIEDTGGSWIRRRNSFAWRIALALPFWTACQSLRLASRAGDLVLFSLPFANFAVAVLMAIGSFVGLIFGLYMAAMA